MGGFGAGETRSDDATKLTEGARAARAGMGGAGRRGISHARVAAFLDGVVDQLHALGLAANDRSRRQLHTTPSSPPTHTQTRLRAQIARQRVSGDRPPPAPPLPLRSAGEAEHGGCGGCGVLRGRRRAAGSGCCCPTGRSWPCA